MSVNGKESYMAIFQVELNGLSKLKMLNVKASSREEAYELAKTKGTKEFTPYKITNITIR